MKIEKLNKIRYTHCLRCGKILKNEVYQQLGYGKTCFKKMCIKRNKNKRLFQKIIFFIVKN